MPTRHVALISGSDSTGPMPYVYPQPRESGASETGWDLGPGTLPCSARIQTNISSSNTRQRNSKTLKITACIHSWGKLWTRRYKEIRNPTATPEEWEQEQGARSKSRALRKPSAHTTTKGWASCLSRPCGPSPSPPPLLTLDKEPVCPCLGGKQGDLSLVFAPPCYSRGPSKALPEFLVWWWCYSVTKLCPTLCDPTDYSTSGFPVLHHLLEFVQIHVH